MPAFSWRSYAMSTFAALLESQREHHFAAIKATSARTRISKLRKMHRWIMDHRSEIRAAIYADFKKPAAEVDISDIKPVLSEIDHTISHLHDWMRPKPVDSSLMMLGTRARIVHEPRGVALILAPWNFPFMLAVGPLVSAVAAGCCVTLKPSEMTPNTTDLIAKMIRELFPQQEVAVVEGDHTVAAELSALPFDHIFFTGSPAVGKKVMAAAAENLTSVTLELGGMNPVIVDETANLEDAARKVIWGKFMNAGQSCMSINSLWVQAKVYEEFLAALRKAYGEMYGDPTQALQNEDIAHPVNRRHFDRLKAMVEGSLAVGAKLVLGNQTDETTGAFAPTILRDVPLSAPVMQEEIFGPILPTMPYGTLQEVMAYIRSIPKPLAINVFTTNDAHAEAIIAQTSSGTTCINDTTLPFIHPNLPFGGVNTSGIGKAHGHAGFLAFTNERSVLQQRVGITTAKLLYPPYKEAVKQTIDLVTKWL